MSSTAVSYTHLDVYKRQRKDYEALAELVVLLLEDDDLRRRVIERQFARVQTFLEPRVREQFVSYLRQLDLLSGVSS